MPGAHKRSVKEKASALSTEQVQRTWSEPRPPSAVVKGTRRGASRSPPAAWGCLEDKHPGRHAIPACSICPPAGRPGAPANTMGRAPTMRPALFRLFKVASLNHLNLYPRETLLLLHLFHRLNKNQGANMLCDLNKVTSCLGVELEIEPRPLSSEPELLPIQTLRVQSEPKRGGPVAEGSPQNLRKDRWCSTLSDHRAVFTER